MSMASSLSAVHCRQAFEQLPPTLRRFLLKYPPVQLYKQQYPNDGRWSQPAPSSDTSGPSPQAIGQAQVSPIQAVKPQFDTDAAPYKSPFEPSRSLGVWRGPELGLKRQAYLLKLAREHQCEALMPASNKRSDAKEAKRLRGLRVKGTGIGERVKGHLRERRMKAVSQERKRAMLDMPRLIEEWKDVSILAAGNFCHPLQLTSCPERPWTGLEEVAQVRNRISR